MDLTGLISGAAAIGSGGVTAIVGIVGQRLFDAWNKKQELDKLKAQWAHEKEMKEADAAIMQQEWAQRTKIAQTEGDAAKDVAASGAFAKSFETEPKSYAAGIQTPTNGLAQAAGWLVMVTLDAVRGVVRPGLTIYLAWIATQMYNEQRTLIAAAGGRIDMATLMLTHGRIVDTLLYLFTTCVLWWFGTRNQQSAPRLR